MKEKISLYKSGDDLLMDSLSILGFTSVSNIEEKVFKKYFKKISYLGFLSWNRKRKRGFYYDPVYFERLRWLIEEFWWIDHDDLTFYVPEIMMPLLVKYRNFYFMISPRVSCGDKRLSLACRKMIAEKYDVKLEEEIVIDIEPDDFLKA